MKYAAGLVIVKNALNVCDRYCRGQFDFLDSNLTFGSNAFLFASSSSWFVCVRLMTRKGAFLGKKQVQIYLCCTVVRYTRCICGMYVTLSPPSLQPLSVYINHKSYKHWQDNTQTVRSFSLKITSLTYFYEHCTCSYYPFFSSC